MTRYAAALPGSARPSPAWTAIDMDGLAATRVMPMIGE